MCVVSLVSDHYYDKWTKKRPVKFVPVPGDWDYHPYIPVPYSPPVITPEEIQEFKDLLDRAIEYDKKTNQEGCELQEKKDRLLKLAKELGVKIDFL